VTGIISLPCFSYGIITTLSSCFPTTINRLVTVSKYFSPEYRNIFSIFESSNPLSEEEGFWEVYRVTTAEVPTRGNLVPDAHLAALLRHHGVKILYTHDRDFMKFSFLDVRDPFS